MLVCCRSLCLFFASYSFFFSFSFSSPRSSLPWLHTPPPFPLRCMPGYLPEHAGREVPGRHLCGIFGRAEPLRWYLAGYLPDWALVCRTGRTPPLWAAFSSVCPSCNLLLLPGPIVTAGPWSGPGWACLYLGRPPGCLCLGTVHNWAQLGTNGTRCTTGTTHTYPKNTNCRTPPLPIPVLSASPPLFSPPQSTSTRPALYLPSIHWLSAARCPLTGLLSHWPPPASPLPALLGVFLRFSRSRSPTQSLSLPSFFSLSLPFPPLPLLPIFPFPPPTPLSHLLFQSRFFTGFVCCSLLAFSFPVLPSGPGCPPYFSSTYSFFFHHHRPCLGANSLFSSPLVPFDTN